MTSKEIILDNLKSTKAEISKFGVSDIGLFGSYSRNEQNKASDIDLLINFAPGRESFDNFMAVYDILENVFKNQKIEVITRSSLSPYIGPRILKEVMYV